MGQTGHAAADRGGWLIVTLGTTSPATGSSVASDTSDSPALLRLDRAAASTGNGEALIHDRQHYRQLHLDARRSRQRDRTWLLLTAERSRRSGPSQGLS